MCSHINTLDTVQGPRLFVRQHGVALTSLSAADRDISLQQMEFIPGALDAQKGTNIELRSLLHQAILVLLPSRRARLEIHTAHLRELMSKLRSHPLSGFADRSAVGIAGRNRVGDGAGLGWSSTVSLAI